MTADETDVRDAGYDEFLDAIETGRGRHLVCPNGHGWLPPRRVCPTCGSRDLDSTTLPATGTVETYTVVHVATPQFEGWTPYVTAIAAFGPVRLTGIVRGVRPEAVELGLEVQPSVIHDDGTRRLGFEVV